MNSEMKIIKSNSIILVCFVFLIICASGYQNISLVNGLTGVYNEDFTTTDYLDLVNTNVTGWGEGELSLMPKEPVYEIVGSYNTTYESEYVLVEGDYAYTLNNHLTNHLQVIDISNTSEPVLNASTYVSKSVAGSNAYSGLFLYGDYLYAMRESIFDVINVTNPTNPIHISEWETGGSFDIHVCGDIAYLTHSTNQMWVLNMTDPSNGGLIGAVSPQVLDVYTSGSSSVVPRGIISAGDFLFFNSGDGGLQILNCSDPTNIQYLSAFDDYNSSFYPRDFWLDGNYVYLTVSGLSSSRLDVIDVTSPNSPFRIAQISSPLAFSEIFVDGNYAYISSDYNGCQIVNITNPFSPEIIGNFSFANTRINDIFVEGEYVFIADSWNFHIIKISDYVKSKEVGKYTDSLSSFNSIENDGNLAYVSAGNGLEIVNITEIQSPTYVGEYISGLSTALDVEGDLLYMSDVSTGLLVLDVSDPSSPSYIGEYSTFPNDIQVLGDTAFLAAATSGLQIVDVSDPSNPSLIDSYIPSSGFVTGVCVYGDKAFISVNLVGLEVIDISNLNNPKKIGGYSTTYAYSVAVEGTHAFLCCGTDGIKVINITSSYAPTLVDSFDTDGTASKVFISGERAYVADDNEGLIILDITDPSDITLDDYYKTLNDVTDVTVKGEHVFITDASSTISILEIKKSKTRERLYENLCKAQSSLIYSDGAKVILNATLSVVDNKPTDTLITYYLSVDNGSNWEEVQPDFDHIFITTGYQLKWKVILTSSNMSLTPTVTSLSISYNAIDVIHEFDIPFIMLNAGLILLIVPFVINKKKRLENTNY